MGKGSNTTTTNSSPPPQVLQNYQNLVGQATNLANTPYQQYQGNLLAPLTDLQNQGIAGLGNAGNVLQPYLNQASQYATSGANPISSQVPGLTGQYANPYASAAPGVLGGLGSGIASYGTGVGSQIAGYGTGVAAQGPQMQQFSAGAVNQYMSPYTQDVVNATQGQFNNENAIQSNNALGSAIQAGNAFGGDRAGVAQGILAGQQQTAEAPVIAGLYNQGYSQALGQFNTNNQQALAGAQTALGAQEAGGQLGLSALGTGAGLVGQGLGLGAQGFQQSQQAALGAAQATASQQQGAGYQFGQLGNEALQGSLAGAQAQLQGGTLEQQQAQAALNIPYSQFLQQQAYPFQTTSYLGNIVEGTGSLSGGTSSTTAPAPSLLGQLFGAAATGVGAYGTLGGFSSQGLPGTPATGANWVAAGQGQGPYAAAKRGGVVGGYDSGGGIGAGGAGTIPYTPIQLPDTAQTPNTQSYFPAGLGGSGVRGSGPPKPPQSPSNNQQPSSSGISDIVKMGAEVAPFLARGGVVGRRYDDGGPVDDGTGSGGYSPALVGWDAMEAPMQQALAANAGLRAQGLCGGGAAHYGDGGDVDDPDSPYNQQVLNDSIAADPSIVNVNLPRDDAGVTPDWGDRQDAPDRVQAGLPAVSPDAPTGVAPAMAAINRAVRPPSAALPYAGSNSDLDPSPSITEVNKTKHVVHGSDGTTIDTGLPGDGSANQTIASSPWMGLVAAGLGMLASKSPFPGVAIGEGGLQGLNYLSQQQKFELERQKVGADINLRQQGLGLEGQKVGIQGQEANQQGQQINQQGQNIQSEIQTRRAGQFDRQFIPGVGWMIYDKGNPLAAPQVVGAPSILPGSTTPTRPGQIGPAPATGANGTPAAPAGGAPVGAAPAPSTGGTNSAPPKPGALGWQPTLNMPANYYPPNHENFLISPDYAKTVVSTGEPVIKEAREQAEAANNTKYILAEMNREAASLPQTGLLAPGSYATQRMDIARNVNTLSHAIGGGDVFQEGDIGAIEQLSKDRFRLGAELSKQIGGREPGFIVQSAVTANPGAENTATGYKRIVSGLQQAAQYKLDRAAFMENWNGRYFGNMNGSQQAFDQLNPPQKYADRAIASTFDPAAIDILRANANNPIARQKFERQYGTGTANLALGAQ